MVEHWAAGEGRSGAWGLPRGCAGGSETTCVPAKGGKSCPHGALHGGQDRHGLKRGAPAEAGQVASSTLHSSTPAQWQPGRRTEPHRLSAATREMGTRTGMRTSCSEGSGGMKPAGSRAEVCEGEAGSRARGAQPVNASFTHYI